MVNTKFQSEFNLAEKKLFLERDRYARDLKKFNRQMTIIENKIVATV